MSSVRVAVGSCVLVLALGASAWGAVEAFPLYTAGHEEQAVRDPQRPPRDPISADDHHRAAVEYWDKARQETVSTAEKRQLILNGIAAEDRALALRPDFIAAITYKNILLRMQAILTDDVQEMNDLLKQADALRSRAIALQATSQREMVFSPAPPPPPSAPRASREIVIRPEGVPPPPPPPPQPPAGWMEYRALVEQHKALRIGGAVKAPAKVRDVRPVYPPDAESARVQGVVIIEALIDANGLIVDARVLRSIPLLDQAALDAVKQWAFEPTLMNGVPTAVVMTVTVNFVLQ